MLTCTVLLFLASNIFLDCHDVSIIKKDGRSFHPRTKIIFMEENSEVLRSEHSIVWCSNWVTWGGRQETLAKFRNVVLEKKGKIQFRR